TAADKMLLDDPLEHRGIALAIPGAFRIDDRDRPALADSEAVGLGAQHAPLLREAEFLETLLQVVPGGHAALFVTALRRRLVGTEEDVALCLGHADLCRHLPFAVPVPHQCASVPFCAQPESIAIIKMPKWRSVWNSKTSRCTPPPLKPSRTTCASKSNPSSCPTARTR